MLRLLFVHGGDAVKDLLEAEVHELVGLGLKIFVADEDGVISVDVRYYIRQFILRLRGKILGDTVVDANLEDAVLVSCPVMHLDELDESFWYLEVFIIWVARHHHHQSEGGKDTLRCHLEILVSLFKILIDAG